MDIWSRVESAAKVFLVFVAGGALSYAGAFPFKPYLHDAFLGTSALTRQVMTAFNVCGGDVWYDAEAYGRADEKTGVTLAKPGHDSNGFVLATIGQSAKLIDRSGQVMHEWRLPYGELPEANGRISGLIPDGLLYWQRAVALPDGDLIAMVNANCLSPDGLALVRLDKDSKVKWVRHGHYHHDFDVMPDGTVYSLWQDPVSDVPKRYADLERPLLDEGIEIISPDGQTGKRTSVLKGFAASKFSTIMDSSIMGAGSKPGDRMHNNNVDILTAQQVAAIPGAKAGDVLLSMRELGTIAVFDPVAENVVWATRGSWFMQHDPDMLPNGNILLFDNQGHWAENGQSRVMEISPATEAVAWQYPAKGSDSKEQRLWTRIRGEQQMLPNGNVLINETQGSRMIEVTRDHQVVWEYVCPFTDPANPGLRCNIMSTRPYGAGDLPFLATLPAKSAMAEQPVFQTIN